MNAQVSFLEGELSIIHIPLALYASFLQPILQVLLPQAYSLDPAAAAAAAAADDDGPDGAAPSAGLTAAYAHRFLNVSVTPVECSVVCATYWATHVFTPVWQRLRTLLSSHEDGDSSSNNNTVSISPEPYVACCVLSGGLDAGSRVVELSSPLALAGIPLFFVTTYYSDFILVPRKDRQSVVQALLARGFAFSELGDSFVAPGSLSHPQAHAIHQRGGPGGGPHGSGQTSSASGPATQQPPPSPPPTNAAELQDRTFRLLRARGVMPYVVPGLHLAHCSGRDMRNEYGGSGGGGGGGGGGNGSGQISGEGGGGGGSGGSGGGSRRRSPQRRGTQHSYTQQEQHQQQQHQKARTTWVDTVDTRLYACLVAALAQTPRFLSITLAAPDPPSVLLDKTLLPLFGPALVGDVGGDLVPVLLDLVALPFEATGIVSGVAGRLVRALDRPELPELSYLSTSKAGAVILASDDAQAALRILQPLLEADESKEGDGSE
ncbi:hypothetical protein SPI_08892 [Niveomyces insectorum RCEF 264]|uniref:CASTOR ACT domain-containing protein n=1 Tax=Niveomyces insectorum RCEF 264 TaxID=1081102 RepID=A0A167MF26_9HYPO|nr:hypothetical protein SPI_08892 [Niveomyces insectorum RCEF 264]